jgi:hypothetical protein
MYTGRRHSKEVCRSAFARYELANTYLLYSAAGKILRKQLRARAQLDDARSNAINPSVQRMAKL